MGSIWLAAWVAIAGNPGPVDFDTDVLPILTKAGCNAAACHGSAAGRGGFKLSLFGGDPAHDYETIVHQLEGRRVNLKTPGRSLLLLKPTGELDHEGGLRIEPDGAQALTVVSWIEQGARRTQSRRLTRVVVQPSQVVLDRPGVFDKLNVHAEFDDGVRRNVTEQAIYYPADPAAVEAGPNGHMNVRRRGQHTVVVRYLSAVATVQINVPLSDDPVDLSAAPRHNWIDDEVLKTLQTLRLDASPQADDATMLRRLRLDLTGRLPTADEVQEYLKDRDPKKFAKLVDRLLESKDFTEYWTFKLATLLRIRVQPRESQAAQTFHNWVRDQIKSRTPWRNMAVSMLTGVGDTFEVGPANFYRAAGDPRKQAEYVSEVLMGARLRCANCHNHPLDKWTQDDYHGLAAVFARIERGRVVRLASRGEVTHPATGMAAVPRVPGERFLDGKGDPRRELADWLASPENPYFAKAMVNRLWKALMGRGLIEPTDDLRATNPATHPALLARLTKDFIDHDYDIRHTLRLIAASAAYARSSRPTPENRGDDRFYSHAVVKPLPAEVLADAISDVTGVWDEYGTQPLGTRAVALYNPGTPSKALDVLGRCSRQDSCETPTGGATVGLTTKLHLINGPLINRKITAKGGTLARAVDAEQSDEQIVRQLYLTALSRPPTPREQAFWKKQLAAIDDNDRRQRLEDFLWSLLSSREFATNH